MSKDKACISAIEEVCKRCYLYKENCGMLDYPDQCISSGRYIDGYHQAEKDLELTWEDIADILDITDVVANDDSMEERLKTMSEEGYCQEVLKRYKDFKERKITMIENNF